MLSLIFILFSHQSFAWCDHYDIDVLDHKLNNLQETLNHIFPYPVPMSFDGKQTWVRIDPSLDRRLTAIEKALKELKPKDRDEPKK